MRWLIGFGCGIDCGWEGGEVCFIKFNAEGNDDFRDDVR